MKLKYIVPNMAQTFGNLEFAGENEVEQQRVNGRYVPVTRSYNLYSDIQRADDIVVILPAKAGEKRFKYEQKVKLVNPKITAEGKNVRGRGYTNYILKQKNGYQTSSVKYHQKSRTIFASSSKKIQRLSDIQVIAFPANMLELW